MNTVKSTIANIQDPDFFKRLDKQKLNSIIALVALVILVDIFLVLIPHFNKITGTYLPRRGEIVRDLSAYKRGAGITSEMKSKLKELEGNVEVGLSRLMAEKDIPEFLSWISTTAKENKVKLMEIKPLKGSVPKVDNDQNELQKRYYPLSINLILKAGYHQLGYFINQLENGEYFIKVTDVDIRSNSSDTIVQDVNLKLATFVLKAQEINQK